jgi:hypothetical protein
MLHPTISAATPVRHVHHVRVGFEASALAVSARAVVRRHWAELSGRHSQGTLQLRREEIGYEFHEASGTTQRTSSRREGPVFLATPIF